MDLIIILAKKLTICLRLSEKTFHAENLLQQKQLLPSPLRLQTSSHVSLISWKPPKLALENIEQKHQFKNINQNKR